MAWRWCRWVRLCSEFVYPHGHMTQDNHTKEEGWPTVIYNCQGSQTQVWCHPIHQAYNCQWSQTQTSHHARPDQTAKGLGQGICWEDERTTQLVAWVPPFVPGVCRRAPCDLCTAADQETGCWFLTSHSPIVENRVVGSSSQPQCPMLQQFLAAWRPQGLLGHLGNKEGEIPDSSQSLTELFWTVWWAL